MKSVRIGLEKILVHCLETKGLGLGLERKSFLHHCGAHAPCPGAIYKNILEAFYGLLTMTKLRQVCARQSSYIDNVNFHKSLAAEAMLKRGGHAHSRMPENRSVQGAEEVGARGGAWTVGSIKLT